MKSIKTLVGKLLPSPEAAPPATQGSTGQPSKQEQAAPSGIKMPTELMAQLFPDRPAMVSVIFDRPDDAASPSPADATDPAKLPHSKPKPLGEMKTPGVLSISDELMETVFPKQKVMVSVLFNENASKPAAPEPVRQPKFRDYSEPEHDFPIV